LISLPPATDYFHENYKQRATLVVRKNIKFLPSVLPVHRLLE